MVVTYGNRKALVEQVLQGIEKITAVEEVILVVNGPSQSKPVPFDPTFRLKVQPIYLENNTGSAGGFAAGIEFFLNERKEEELLLLDDDTVIDPASATEFFRSWAHSRSGNELTAMNCFRRTKRAMRKIKSGEVDRKLFPQRGEFLGVDVLNWKSTHPITVKDQGVYSVPMGPYGGLLLNRKTLERIGLPDRNFFLYLDDYDYTQRIVKAGGQLLLNTNVEMFDLDVNEMTARASAIPLMKYVTGDALRVFFSVRNALVLSANTWHTPMWRLNLNVMIVWLYLFFLCVIKLRPGRIKLITKAVKSGYLAAQKTPDDKIAQEILQEYLQAGLQ